jgi:FkbM family methyltransferase
MQVSYAQVLEDVLLFRALKNVANGFYIDVGANDPERDSVTRSFYRNGWRGINIEASPVWFEKLAKNRPEDINLNLAASNAVGVAEFYDIAGTGLSTTVKEFADRHSLKGHKNNAYTVPTEPLASICEKHVHRPIHFLKIDVEGAEKEVLEGADFTRFRPWILVIEATEPLSSTPTFQNWEPLVTEHQYQFVHFDGLNRFYVASEHAELGAFFAFGADAYEKATAIWTREHLKKKVLGLEAERKQLQGELEQLKGELQRLQHETQSLRESGYRRLTKPVRAWLGVK